MKPHDYASWLRGSLTAHPCADSELARIHSGHPAGLFSATSPPRNGIQVKSTQRCCVSSPLAANDFDFDLPARSGRQVLDGPAACGTRWERVFGRGTGCAFDRTRPVLAQSCGFIARPTGHRDASFGYFSLREKSDWVGGSRTIRMTHLATDNTRRKATQGPDPHPRHLWRRDRGAQRRGVEGLTQQAKVAANATTKKSGTAQKEEGRG